MGVSSRSVPFTGFAEDHWQGFLALDSTAVRLLREDTQVLITSRDFKHAARKGDGTLIAYTVELMDGYYFAFFDVCVKHTGKGFRLLLDVPRHMYPLPHSDPSSGVQMPIGAEEDYYRLGDSLKKAAPEKLDIRIGDSEITATFGMATVAIAHTSVVSANVQLPLPVFRVGGSVIDALEDGMRLHRRQHPDNLHPASIALRQETRIVVQSNP